MKRVELNNQKKQAEAIMAKFNREYSEFEDHATNEEKQTVMIYIANEANHKQRIIAGLDPDDEGLR